MSWEIMANLLLPISREQKWARQISRYGRKIVLKRNKLRENFTNADLHELWRQSGYLRIDATDFNATLSHTLQRYWTEP